MYLWFLITLLIILGLYLYSQNNLISTSSYKIFNPKLHSEMKGKKIVFLSDTHFRDKISDTFIDQLLTQIEEIDPDLILFGGDIVHKATSDIVIEHVKDFFVQLVNIAPTYVILGNHDIGSTRVKKIEGVLNRAGATLLKNKATWISFGEPDAGFWLTGLNANESSFEMKSDALEQIDTSNNYKSGPKVLLTHYPHFFEKYLMNNEKRPDLILAGHAYGG